MMIYFHLVASSSFYFYLLTIKRLKMVENAKITSKIAGVSELGEQNGDRVSKKYGTLSINFIGRIASVNLKICSLNWG